MGLQLSLRLSPEQKRLLSAESDARQVMRKPEREVMQDEAHTATAEAVADEDVEPTGEEAETDTVEDVQHLVACVMQAPYNRDAQLGSGYHRGGGAAPHMLSGKASSSQDGSAASGSTPGSSSRVPASPFANIAALAAHDSNEDLVTHLQASLPKDASAMREAER